MAYIPLYICTTSSLPIHLLVDIQAVSMSWLLWIVLLQTFWITVFELHFCPDIFLGVGLQGHRAALSLVFWGTTILFSIVAATTYIPTSPLWKVHLTWLRAGHWSSLPCRTLHEVAHNVASPTVKDLWQRGHLQMKAAAFLKMFF